MSNLLKLLFKSLVCPHPTSFKSLMNDLLYLKMSNFFYIYQQIIINSIYCAMEPNLGLSFDRIRKCSQGENSVDWTRRADQKNVADLCENTLD